MGFREFIWGQSWVYRLNQRLVWRRHSLDWLVSDVIRPTKGMNLLDIS